MAHRAFRRGASAIAHRRETTWFQFVPVTTNLATGGADAIVFALNAAALALRPFTIVRTHFELALASDQAAAIEHQICGVGIAVVSDQAVAVGVTAVPNPVTHMGSNLWLMHQLLYGDESALTDRTRSETRVSVDSKAMRKVEVGQDIVVVVENGGSSGLNITVGGRLLIKNT